MTLKATLFAQAITGGGALDYYTALTASPVPTTSLKAVWTQGTNVITLSIGAGVEIKAALPIKDTNIVMYDLDYVGQYNTTNGGDSALTIQNTRYFPY